MKFSKKELRRTVNKLNVPDFGEILPEYKKEKKRKQNFLPRIAAACVCALVIAVSVAVGVKLYGQNTPEPQILSEDAASRIIYAEKADSSLKIISKDQENFEGRPTLDMGASMGGNTANGSVSASGNAINKSDDADRIKGEISGDLQALMRQNSGSNVKFSVLVYFNSQRANGIKKITESYGVKAESAISEYVSAVLTAEQINGLVCEYSCIIYSATKYPYSDLGISE